MTKQCGIRDQYKIEASPRYISESVITGHHLWIGQGKSYGGGSAPAPKNSLGCAVAVSALQLVDGDGSRCQQLPQGVVLDGTMV